ncbi:MAG TPA: immunoglobulin domain-containing protein, partial [Verrucomicrobiae bacterium]
MANCSCFTGAAGASCSLPRSNWRALAAAAWLVLGGAVLAPSVGAADDPPSIAQQPKRRTVLPGANHTFSVTAIGTGPLHYQWTFNGTSLAGATDSTLALSNIQASNGGPYQVIITNSAGAVTSSVATLTVHVPGDPLYAAPNGGWSYFYTGDGVAPSDFAALDGTWDHNNGSDSWDGLGRGAGNGAVGGVDTAGGILTIEDALNSGTGDNRRLYFTHNIAQDASVTNAGTLLDDGVTVSFRARLTPPTDPLLELTNAPNGWVNLNDGKGIFGLRQSGGGGEIISFSLNNAIEDTGPSSTFNFGQAGLHLNNLNGDVRSSFVDPGEGGTTNLLPLAPTIFHEFWITIQDNGADPGTHRVSVYLDGSRTPTVFNVTAGTGSEGATPTNYLALGLGSTPQRGAVDLDFFNYRQGVVAPQLYDDPVGIVAPPVNQLVATGQTATYQVGVTGAPPYSFQWYKNGAPIPDATNASHTTPPVVSGDSGSQFVVVICNDFNTITSAPPALLTVAMPPTISAQPQSLTATNGDTVPFNVTASGDGTLSYQWRFNGGNLSGETGSTLTLTDAAPAKAGNYDVIVSNLAGSITSAVAILTIKVQDFGDAPAPYPTLRANNGARHLIISGLYLGAAEDLEPDGQPNATATGDDLNGSTDEDGVSFPAPLRVGQSATIQVVASAAGFLDAWIDCNHNFSWAEAGDRIFNSQPVVAGTNVLNFSLSAMAIGGNTFARFRFSTAGGLSFDGPAADGEVEDYAVTLVPVADLMVSKIQSANPIAVSSNLVYTITVTNAGPSPATGVVLTDALPGGVTFVSASASQGSCAQNAGTVTCSLDSVSNGSVATVTITVVPDATGTITNSASVTANELDLNLADNTASVTATVLDAPVITAQPQSLTVTNGNSA